MSGFSTNGLNAAVYPLTGLEQVAADTQLTQGQNPESVAITSSMLKGYFRAPSTLTSAVIVASDASLSDLYKLTLATNSTLANPTNLQAGQTYRVEVTQDATGARTMAFGTLYKFSGASTLTTTAGAIDMFTFTYDGTSVLGTLALKFA